MFRPCARQCCAASVGAAGAAAASSSPGSAANPSTSNASVPMTANTQFTLHSLYRRLLKTGESGEMMQRSISVSGLQQSLKYGMELLKYHKGLTEVDAQAQALSFFHPIKRIKLAISRRVYAWKLFKLQLTLRSKNAISNLLVYLLFLTVCGLVYGVYRACRVGVNRAEDRYRTLAIPIVQTFEALEEAQLRRQRLHKEMEEDIRVHR